MRACERRSLSRNRTKRLEEYFRKIPVRLCTNRAARSLKYIDVVHYSVWLRERRNEIRTNSAKVPLVIAVFHYLRKREMRGRMKK